MPTGRGAFFSLAWIVFTFAGAGAALLLKSFLEKIGTELGKEFIDYWLKRKQNKRDPREPKALFPCAVIYEAKPGLLVVVPLFSSEQRGLAEMPGILELADQALPDSGDPHLIARFDTGSGRWTLDPFEFEYLSKTKK
jgi:hypothetical protein